MFYKITGLIFVGLGILGALLPVLPTTPFILVAAACFAKSSPYLYQKLLQSKMFGPLIHNWQKHRGISKKSKYVALTTMVLGFGWTCYLTQNVLVIALVALLMVYPSIFVARLPIVTKEHDLG